MERRLTIRVLGTFDVEVDGEPVAPEAWRQRRAAAVVKLLALAPGHRLTREQLIDALWPDLSPGHGGGNLRKALHFGRQAMGGQDTLVVRAGMVELAPQADVATDVERFEWASRQALASADPDACRAAADLYAGDLLPDDRYEPWLDNRREHLRAQYLAVLKGAGLWRRVLEMDPLDEGAHQEVMRAHLQAGNRQAAMRQFERLRTTLAEELGVGPDPTSVALYQQVLSMEGPDVPTPAERARALLAWGLVHWERKDLEEAETTAAEARALAIDAGLGREFGEASGLLGLIAQSKGRWWSTFREQFLQSIRDRPELAPFVFDANLCTAEYSLYEPGGHEQARRFGRDLLAAAEEAGSAQGRALATLLLGEAELLTGRLEQAEDQLRGAAKLHQAAHADSGHSLSLERLAETETALGRRWQARRTLRRALRLAEGAAVSSHLLPKVYGSMVEAEGDPVRASKAVDMAEQALAGRNVCRPCSIGLHVASAIACARGGDAARARHHATEAERIAGLWQGGPWHAAVREAQAELALADGNHTEAAGLFARAAEMFASAGRPLDQARCRLAAMAPSSTRSR